MSAVPGPRLTRKQSKALEMAPPTNPLLTKRTYYFNQVNRVKEAVDDKIAFEAWRQSDIQERIKVLDNATINLEKIFIDMACELDEDARPSTQEDQNMQDLISNTRADLAERLRTLQKKEELENQANNANHANQANQSVHNPQAQQPPPMPYKIEVQHTDPTGNVPNVWGKFDGDYAKWKPFRDRWIAAMHENNAVKPIVKFQNLQTACVGKAKGALGQWDLTEENYQKAWQRLSSVYEDDYMQA